MYDSHPARSSPEEGQPDLSTAQQIYELMNLIGAEWSLVGGSKNPIIDKAKLEEIDDKFPLPGPGKEDLNLAGRVISTVFLALEAAGKLKPSEELNELIASEGIDPTDIDGRNMEELFLLLAKSSRSLTEDLLARMVVEIEIARAYEVAGSLDSYTAKEDLKRRTSAYDENNVVALAVIYKMHRQGLIGSITKGRSESIIRLLLEKEI